MELEPIQKARKDKHFQFFLARICGQHYDEELGGYRVQGVVFRGINYVYKMDPLPDVDDTNF